MRQIEAEHVLNFADVIGESEVAALGFTPTAEPLILSVSPFAGNAQTEGTRKTTSMDLYDDPVDYHIHCRRDGQWQTLHLPLTREIYHYVQPLGSDRWLLVRGRCSSADDLNAHIYSADGVLQRSFHAGDGISDVQTTPDGHIWMGYIDEGVFSTISEVSQSGLVCFNSLGELTFKWDELPRHADDPRDFIDCYVLNVTSSEDVWLYYYDGGLVHLHNRQHLKYYSIRMNSPQALAIHQDRLLFQWWYHFGNDEQQRLITLGLASLDGSATDAEELEPVYKGLPVSGEPAAEIGYYARGSKLFIRRSHDLLSVTLS